MRVLAFTSPAGAWPIRAEPAAAHGPGTARARGPAKEFFSSAHARATSSDAKFGTSRNRCGGRHRLQGGRVLCCSPDRASTPSRLSTWRPAAQLPASCWPPWCAPPPPPSSWRRSSMTVRTAPGRAARQRPARWGCPGDRRVPGRGRHLSRLSGRGAVSGTALRGGRPCDALRGCRSGWLARRGAGCAWRVVP